MGGPDVVRVGEWETAPGSVEHEWVGRGPGMGEFPAFLDSWTALLRETAAGAAEDIHGLEHDDVLNPRGEREE